jgi:hypothetical protein
MRRGLFADRYCMLFLVGLVYEMAFKQDLGGGNNSYCSFFCRKEAPSLVYFQYIRMSSFD